MSREHVRPDCRNAEGVVARRREKDTAPFSGAYVTFVEIRAGDVVWCPPGVRHWHGATPTIALTHIALTGTVGGKNVDWLEKLIDEQYSTR